MTTVINRLAVMAAIFVALILPITMIYGLVSERTSRRDEAAKTISDEWGRAQTIYGPVLSVPFRYHVQPKEAPSELVDDRATFLPEALHVVATLTPELRSRGLFGVPVYRAALKISGHFQRPAIERVYSDPVEVRWNEAQLTVAMSDSRGIVAPVQLTWVGEERPVDGGVADPVLGNAGVSAAVIGLEQAQTTLPFTLSFELNGTRSLKFLPVGNSTVVSMQSSWRHPGFNGAPLPYRHTVGDDGFTAEWRVPHFGRGFSGAWRAGSLNRERFGETLAGSVFGVTLVQPVDIYQQTERAVKYAALFIVMTFVIGFLWEIIGRVVIHPIQYLFIGFALCLFYLLLLSFSEHIGFDYAYMAAAVPTVGLIAWYWQWVVHARGRALLMLSALSALYGFLYLLLRAEDAALLAGSLGLFTMLAIVMFLTRRIDWYNLRIGSTGQAGEQ